MSDPLTPTPGMCMAPVKTSVSTSNKYKLPGVVCRECIKLSAQVRKCVTCDHPFIPTCGVRFTCAKCWSARKNTVHGRSAI